MLTLMPRHERRKYAKALHVKKLVGIQDKPTVVKNIPRVPNTQFIKNEKPSSITDHVSNKTNPTPGE